MHLILIAIGLIFSRFIISINKFQKIYPHLCNFSFNEYGNSTKRDVIFFFTNGFSSGLEIALKSLRSSGSLCRIIVFSQDSFFLPPRKNNLFDQLGVELVVSNHKFDSRPFIPHLIRYEYEKDWLEQHLMEVDRVIHSDAFDVFFQRDPFNDNLPLDKILFVLEPHMIRSCGWNLEWLESCYNVSIANEIRHNYIICSGTIGGSASEYLKLLHLIISTKEWKKCWSSSMDQPIINYLVWKGFVKGENIKYTFTGCNGDFFTMQWCTYNEEINFNEFGMIESLDKTIPSVVHQYNRNLSLVKYLYSKCQVFPVPT